MTKRFLLRLGVLSILLILALRLTAQTCVTPQGIISQNITSSSANLSWAAVSGAPGYYLAYYTTDPSVATYLTPTTNSVSLTDLKGETTYHFWEPTNCGNNSFSPLSAVQTFTTLPVVHLSFTSVKDGSWADPTTWSTNSVPTTNDDVTVNHTVSIPTAGTSICRNLTLNGTITNSTEGGYLKCNGNMTINSMGYYDGGSNFVNANYGQYNGGGVLAVGADKANLGSQNSNSLANNTSVNLTGGRLDGYVVLGGRIVAQNNAIVNLKGGDFTGWYDPNDATPQYIVGADNTSTVTIAGGTYLLRPNGTQPHFSPNIILTSATPTCPSGATFTTFQNGGNYTFGASDKDQTMGNLNTITGFPDAITFLRMNVAGLQYYSSGTNAKTVTSVNSKFNSIGIFGAPTTLYGSYTLINSCTGGAPGFSIGNNVSIDNSLSMTINVPDSALIDLGSFATNETFNFLGTFAIQNGKVIVKGGTLDLRNATVTGLDQNHYFITKPNFNNTKMGAILLPAASSTPITFNVGISVPNGAAAPTSVYAPVGIVSNNGSSNVSVNLQVLQVPAGYVAPSIQWNITASGGSPNLTMTLTWPPSVESTLFANNRNLAKIFHYNSTTMVWEKLTTSALVTNTDGSFSLTATNVTAFSPFMVAIPASVLSAELLSFTAKQNGTKAELTWQTANEVNVKNFDIEKSLEGKTFSKFAEVKAHNTPSVYAAFDDTPFWGAGGLYYRLKINDLDGTSKYSNIVFLEKGSDKTIKIRHNTEGSVWIETNDKIESIIVSNSIGQVLLTTKDSRLSLAHLPKGIYIVSVKTDKAMVTEKVFNF